MLHADRGKEEMASGCMFLRVHMLHSVIINPTAFDPQDPQNEDPEIV